MKFIKLIPAWAQPIFESAGLNLNFSEELMNCGSCTLFSNKVKCCTFYPNLMNFAVGFELKSGRAPHLRELLKNSEVALPLGIFAPPSYKEAYSKTDFGTSEDLLCPHYNRSLGDCSIWSSRPSSCVSYVCKSSLGERGQSVWKGVEAALASLEMNLAYEAALQLGLVNYEIHVRNWKANVEEKEQVYLRAADYVESLSVDDKIRAAGESFSAHLSDVLGSAQV